MTLAGGSLPAGPASCTIVVLMDPPSNCGKFKNTAKNFELVGLNVAPNLEAELNIRCIELMDADLTKVVTGVPPSFAGTFNFSLSCSSPGGVPVTTPLSVNFTAAWALVPYKHTLAKVRAIQLPWMLPGTSCTLTETPPPPPPGCAWQPPVYNTPNGSFTVSATISPAIVVTNALKCDAARPRRD